MFTRFNLFIWVLSTVTLLVTSVPGGFSSILVLERVSSTQQTEELSKLRARDQARHSRILQRYDGVVNFTLQGSPDPYTSGVYFTRLRVGSPPREFYMLMDSGSDIPWINGIMCTGCPKSSGLGIPLSFYDPQSSSSSSTISCFDKICMHKDGCSIDNSHCTYSYPYEDQSVAKGYYVSDTFYFDMIMGNSSSSSLTAKIFFGCSTNLSGHLATTIAPVDGLLAFGRHSMSITSQLSSQGLTPKVFSHCLKGGEKGGGIMVLGEAMAPGMVYSPLIPDQPNYALSLLSIAVGEKLLSLDPKVFASSDDQGAVVDSGTTLSYFPEEAYDKFIYALIAAVPSVPSYLSNHGDRCFQFSSSINVNEVFPLVTLKFAGDADMVLKPKEYLVKQIIVLTAGVQLWCTGFQKAIGHGTTILGDLVLQDKLIVVDQDKQQIRWAPYDCSTSVNVSLPSSKEKHKNESIRNLSRGANYWLLLFSFSICIFFYSL